MKTDVHLSGSRESDKFQVSWPTDLPTSWNLLDPNMTSWESGSNMTSDGNVTQMDTDPKKTVHDLEYDVSIRKAILYVQIVIGILGAVLLFTYMLHTRSNNEKSATPIKQSAEDSKQKREKTDSNSFSKGQESTEVFKQEHSFSYVKRMLVFTHDKKYTSDEKVLTRVNALILNLCVADLLVVCFSCVVQLVWEYLERHWLAGDVMCRVIKMLQIFGICASTNMLVVIAVDRHQAITAPLRKQFSVLVMVSVGWGVALLCSTPMLYVFHARYDDNKNKTMCENIFRGKPMIHRQAFLTYAACVNFLIPLIILCVCYIRIFLKIARKASDSRTTKRQSFKPGKIHLTSNTTSATLHSAKLKTLRMTVVIVTCFIVCGLPYFFAEMIMSYGDFNLLSPAVYGLLGGIAVANSAVNPYIFLLFSVNVQCLRNLKLCPAQTGPNNRQLMYNGSVRSREYSSAYSRTPITGVSTDAYELTTTSKSSRAAGYNSRWRH